jgi:hypothetical protein
MSGLPLSSAFAGDRAVPRTLCIATRGYVRLTLAAFDADQVSANIVFVSFSML